MTSKRSASQATASARVKDGTSDKLVDLASAVDPSMKKRKTGSHAARASDRPVVSAKEDAGKAVVKEGAAKGGVEPAAAGEAAVEAGKEATTDGGQTKHGGAAKAIVITFSQSPSAEVVDADVRTNSLLVDHFLWPQPGRLSYTGS
jgi:hypothetical protein